MLKYSGVTKDMYIMCIDLAVKTDRYTKPKPLSLNAFASFLIV